MVAIWLEWGRREGKAGGELMPSQEEMGIRERGRDNAARLATPE